MVSVRKRRKWDRVLWGLKRTSPTISAPQIDPVDVSALYLYFRNLSGFSWDLSSLCLALALKAKFPLLGSLPQFLQVFYSENPSLNLFFMSSSPIQSLTTHCSTLLFLPSTQHNFLFFKSPVHRLVLSTSRHSRKYLLSRQMYWKSWKPWVLYFLPIWYWVWLDDLLWPMNYVSVSDNISISGGSFKKPGNALLPSLFLCQATSNIRESGCIVILGPTMITMNGASPDFLW